jgi:hypothetical protein
MTDRDTRIKLDKQINRQNHVDVPVFSFHDSHTHEISFFNYVYLCDKIYPNRKLHFSNMLVTPYKKVFETPWTV